MESSYEKKLQKHHKNEMKKQSQRKKKKKSTKKKTAAVKKRPAEKRDAKLPQKEQVKQRTLQPVSKKSAEKKGDEGTFLLKGIGKAGQFLRESKNELKKVKWPTRKELLASTAVVIVLTLIVALFLGLVDFGLIKVIKTIVG
jgi:preprotein translocase subunit SecE